MKQRPVARQQDTEQLEKPVSPDLYTEQYFLTACEGYDEFVASEGEHLSRRLSAAFALASVEKGMKVLDVGCGRGEILRHCARLGADAYGIDYAPVAVNLTREVIDNTTSASGQTGVGQADAKKLPFPTGVFDRALLFDVVEHLHPWELHEALLEIRRVLKPEGKLIIHTAPNVWYDRYAYPLVRTFRILIGQGAKYPANPREFLVDHNQHVHVNEQSMMSLQHTLRKAGFRGKVWLDSPPQGRQNPILIDALRSAMFKLPPFRWFFEREVFAVASKHE
ncbi:MAG: class I SAM-dependent methyltransferase [Anaerolinea sp.]|nr:class I SAM-dependent methyltransferase [Anaerolinea sp.]MCC6974522.1 class I SAM-dependent methyltransferase [Anaerolineae bacterium]